MFCLAMACLLLSGAAAAEEWSIPEGKTEAELSYTPDMLNGTFMCGYSYDNRITGVLGGYWTAYLCPQGDQDGKEPAVRGQVTMLSGTGSQGKVFRLEKTDDGLGLSWDTSTVPKGDATYRLDLESEHYWASTEFSVTFMDIRKVEIEQLQETVTFRQRQRTDINTVIDSSVLRIKPEMPYSLYVGTFDAYEADSEEYSCNFREFTGKIPGDYKVWLRVMVGVNEAEIRYPITVHVEEVPELTWDEKEDGQLNLLPYHVEGTWLSNYAGDSRTDPEFGRHTYALALYPQGDERDEDKREDAVRTELTMISGDESLRDAFSVTADAFMENVGDRVVEGEATYLLKAESEHYRTSLEFKATFVDFAKTDVSILLDTVEAPLDEDLFINGSAFLSTVVKTEPEITPVYARFPYSDDPDDPDGGYEIRGRNFIARKAGTYPMTMVLELGCNDVRLNVPMTFHVRSAEEKEAEWNANWPPEGRTEARFAEGDGHWDGTFFIHGGDGASSYHHGVRLSDDLSEWEDAQQCHVTFVSGDEHLRDFVKEDNRSDERAGFRQDASAAEKPGTAVFRIDAYSEHYYLSRTVSMTVVDAGQVTVELVTDTVNVPVSGEEIYLPGLFTERKYVSITPEYGYSCSVFAEGEEWQVDDENLTLEWGRFTAKKAGDYPLILRVSVGEFGLYRDLPFTVHAAEDITAAAVAGAAPVNDTPEQEWTTGERDYYASQRNAAQQSAGSGVTVGQSAEFSGTEKVTAECSNLERELRNVWFYVPSTLPEDVYGSSATIYLSLNPIGKYKSVIPTAYSAEMISGDEGLKDILQFTDHTYEGSSSRSLYLNVNTYGITAPGEATFRVRLEEGKLYYEEEFTVRVLSWEDYPLFDIIEGGDAANVKLSTGEDNTYYSESIAAMFLTDHFDRIIADHPELASDSSNKQVYVYERGQYPEDQLRRGYTYNGTCYQFLSFGSYDFSLQYNFGALYYNRSVTLNALPYQIQGRGVPAPGGSVRYSIRDEQPEIGRSFTWTVTGDGVVFDPETQILTIPEDVPERTEFRVTAAPSDGGTAASVDGMVWSGALPNVPFVTNSSGGFRAPVMLGGGMALDYSGYQMINYLADPDSDYDLVISHGTSWLNEFAEEPEKAEAYYDNLTAALEENGTGITENKTVMVGGHPALLILMKGEDNTAGAVIYARNMGALQCVMTTAPKNGAALEDIPQVSMRDLERIAENISYNPAEALLTVDDVAVTVTGGTAVTAGKKLQLKAEFANPERVNKKEKNNEVAWTVTDGQGGDAPEGIQIDSKGVLTADKAVTEVSKVRVTATSVSYGSTGTLEVTVIPAADGISVEPAELFFYIGSEKTETVKAQVTPDTVPPVGITWIPKKEGIVEVVPDDENGTAQISALKAGVTEVTVTEPGGKKAKLKVTAAEPVTAVELSVKGKTAPGGTVTVTAKLTPKKPGNSALEWTLDADEETAVINEKGQVKIAKTAPVGTVITVTCRALGAPEPIEAKIQIEVTEK